MINLTGLRPKRLKNLRITASTSNQEYKITRLSELPCNLHKFTLKKKGCESGQDDPEEITVYDYFVNRRNIALAFSAALPCINVGKPNRSVYIPIEALKNMNYNSEPMIQKCGISITSGFTQFDRRVLQAPMLKLGNGEDFSPKYGIWNFDNKKFVQPVKIVNWAVVNFSAKWDVQGLVRDLTKCGEE